VVRNVSKASLTLCSNFWHFQVTILKASAILQWLLARLSGVSEAFCHFQVALAHSRDISAASVVFK